MREMKTYNKNIIFEAINLFPVKVFWPFSVCRLTVSLCLEDLFFDMSLGGLLISVLLQLLLLDDISILCDRDKRKLKMDFRIGLFHTVSTFILIRGVIF